MPGIDLIWNVLFTGLFAIALFLGVSWQSQGIAAAVLISHGICLPLLTIWATWYVFKRLSSLPTLLHCLPPKSPNSGGL